MSICREGCPTESRRAASGRTRSERSMPLVPSAASPAAASLRTARGRATRNQIEGGVILCPISMKNTDHNHGAHLGYTR
jgi:hypothetical protein